MSKQSSAPSSDSAEQRLDAREALLAQAVEATRSSQSTAIVP